MKLFILLCLSICSIWATPFAHKKLARLLKPNNERIVGGNVAKDGQFPWQVAVYYDTEDGSFFCGGALIDQIWVLTAGHCVYGAKEFTLHLGSNNLVEDDPNRVTLGAVYSVTHPDFDPNEFSNNIGLIRIDTSYEINEFIQVIPLGQFPVVNNSDVTVSGWGASGDWDGAEPDLKFVNLKTIDNKVCQTVYGNAVGDDILCATGPSDEGICNGDIGSPLVSYDTENRPIHVGIAIWASETGCDTSNPSGYTRTAPYIDWIKNEISA